MADAVLRIILRQRIEQIITSRRRMNAFEIFYAHVLQMSQACNIGPTLPIVDSGSEGYRYSMPKEF